MYRLAHISDAHLGPMPNIGWTKLLSKRLTGYINWQRNRAKQFSPDILSGLLSHMLKARPDHIVITGDLINLSLAEEIARAKIWLEAIGSGKNVSIVCGNHDAYIKGMLEVAIQSWQEYLIGDDRKPVINNSSFPILRHRGPCSLILVNTAVPTKPFNSTGLFDQEQAEKLEQMLHQERDNCRVILIHHPPFENATSPSKELIGQQLFRDVVHQKGAELILHGHTHLDTYVQIDSPDKPAPVICVPAAGQGIGGRKPAARYNWFEIEGKSGNWNINHTKFGYRDNNQSITRL
jgi:3',5'-cyclic AMP phosphodiesterase CpdA